MKEITQLSSSFSIDRTNPMTSRRYKVDDGVTAKFLPLKREFFAGSRDGKENRMLFNRLKFLQNTDHHNLE